MEAYTCPAAHVGLLGKGKTAALVITILFPILVTASVALFHRYRNSSVFLRKRSLKVVIASATGTLVTWSVTALYDTIGPSGYPCWLFLLLNMAMVPLVNLTPLVALARYRNDIAAMLLSEKKHQARLSTLGVTDVDERPLETISWCEAFDGHIRTTFGSKKKIDRLRHAKFARSIYFVLFYGGINSLPYAVYYFVKIGIDPKYYMGCHGCELDVSDAIFLLVLVVLGSGMGVFLNSSRIKKRDALRIVRECVFAWLFSGIFLFSGLVLFLTDPGSSYSSGAFNYRLILLAGVYGTLYVQTVHQVLMAARLKLVLITSNHINQIELFQDVMKSKELRAELQAHLNSELSNEILPFLEGVESFKTNFQNPEANARRAERIMGTFIIRNAPLEVNISAAARAQALSIYSSGALTPEMFDRAYDEVKTSLLGDGFARYLREQKRLIAEKQSHTSRQLHISTGLTSLAASQQLSVAPETIVNKEAYDI